MTAATIPGLTYDELKALRPCSGDGKRVVEMLGGASKWNGNRVSAQTAREAGATFGDLVWAASAVARNNPDVERRLRLWMADCAARVLHIYEKTETSAAPREAIIATRQFARGEISAAARDAARAAASAAARAAASAAAWAAASAAAWAAAWDAARAAAWAAAWAARDAASAAEEAWQFDRLILWLGESEPEDWPLPAPPVRSEAA